MTIGRTMMAGAALAGALAVSVGSAHAQRRSEADYAQGIQQSALAFAAQTSGAGRMRRAAMSPAAASPAGCMTSRLPTRAMRTGLSMSGRSGADQRRQPRYGSTPAMRLSTRCDARVGRLEPRLSGLGSAAASRAASAAVSWAALFWK